MGRDQLGHALPDQDPHAAGAGAAFQHSRHSAPDGDLSETGAQGGDVEEDEEYGAGCPEPHPDCRPGAVVARAQTCQEEKHEDVDTNGQTQHRAAALRPEDCNQLSDEHEEVAATCQDACEGIVRRRKWSVLRLTGLFNSFGALSEQKHETGDGPLKRKKEGHYEIGGQEDGVAGIGGDTGCHIFAPWQGVPSKVLNHAVDGDGQAGEYDGVLQAAQLGGVAQVGRGQNGDS